jgi:hypothetical protein
MEAQRDHRVVCKARPVDPPGETRKKPWTKEKRRFTDAEDEAILAKAE